MQPQVHTRVGLVCDEMMLFSRFADDNVAGDHVVSVSINLHPGFALQQDEHLRVISVNVPSVPVARGTRAANVM